jgi:hypothetical protein
MIQTWRDSWFEGTRLFYIVPKADIVLFFLWKFSLRRRHGAGFVGRWKSHFRHSGRDDSVAANDERTLEVRTTEPIAGRISVKARC